MSTQHVSVSDSAEHMQECFSASPNKLHMHMFTTFPKQHFERLQHPRYKQGPTGKLARV